VIVADAPASIPRTCLLFGRNFTANRITRSTIFCRPRDCLTR
jgi:hypothetical protein